jgi:hypothetical protein
MPEIAPMKLQCDLVMRGGIASGLVYPRAIAKLAETHDFRSIGGTSVGAIAAAGTAAAAWGTKVGQDHFQTRLKHLPEELSEIRDGKTVLERLFQPQPGTRRLFRVLMAGLRHENKFLKVARIIALLCLNYLPIAVLGAAIALIPLIGLRSHVRDWRSPILVFGRSWPHPGSNLCRVDFLNGSVVGRFLGSAEEWLRYVLRLKQL